MSKERKAGVAAVILTAIAITSINPAMAQNYNQYKGYDYGKQNTTNQYGGYQPNYQGYQQMQPLRGSVASVSAGTMMSASISGMVSSANSAIGMPVRAILGNDVIGGNGNVVLPAGTLVEGQVTSLTKAGGFARNGQLGVIFNSATTPNGQRFPITAKIATEDGTGILKGGTGKSMAASIAKNTIAGTAIGAVAGTALGPMAGGHVGRGAVYGTAVGAGAGLFSNALKKGVDAVIPSSFQIQLDTPVNIGAGY
ncbi:MAG: hypothetical protein WCK67_06750 [bacterium]